MGQHKTEDGRPSDGSRFATDASGITPMGGGKVRVIDLLTPEQKASNAAHDAGMKEIQARLRAEKAEE